MRSPFTKIIKLKPTFFKNNFLQKLFIIGFILFISSLFIYYSPIILKNNNIFSLFHYRGVRALISVVFLLIAFYYRSDKKSAAVLLFFLFYSISNIASIWYEENILAISSMFFNFIAYTVLIIALIKKISFKNLNKLFAFLFFIMVLIIGFFIYQFILSFKIMTISKIHYFFILLSGISAVVLSFFTLLYNHQYSTSTTAVFTLFVILIFFSEIFRGIAYYNIAYGIIGVFVARGLLILGLITGTNYCYIKKREDEKLHL